MLKKLPMLLVLCLSTLFLLMGCQPALNDGSEAILLQTETLQLRVNPARIPVETPLTLSVETTRPLLGITAEIRGISMYMGRIPLQWRQVENTAATEMPLWHAEFFLGACSDPDMKWELQLWLDYGDGRLEMQTVQFTSSWR